MPRFQKLMWVPRPSLNMRLYHQGPLLKLSSFKSPAQLASRSSMLISNPRSGQKQGHPVVRLFYVEGLVQFPDLNH